MKRPLRDSLLARHAGAQPALDALRRAALPPERLSLREAWREFFQVRRTAWSAIAAVWVAILAANLVSKNSAPPTPADPRERAAALLAWRETQEQLDVLFAEDRSLR